MGSVDLAMRREGTFRRLFAVKRLLGHFRDDDDVRSMFLDEARIAGLLRHPNVVSVVDVGEDEAGPFLVMDYVEGLSLSSIASRTRRQGIAVPVQVCADIVAQCAHGLQAAHELRGHDGTWLKLVHRDVSPHNILVGFDGVVRLTDFGIAKAAGRATRTSTGLLKGKIAYMAPEQLRFEEPDRRSDLFALGVVAYELVSGGRLFAAETPRDVARKILNEDPEDVRTRRPEVPDALATLLGQMLARDPAQRPENAGVVARTLDEIVAQLALAEGRSDVASFMGKTFQEARDESARRTFEAMTLAESAPGLDALTPPSSSAASAADGDATRAQGRKDPSSPRSSGPRGGLAAASDGAPVTDAEPSLVITVEGEEEPGANASGTSSAPAEDLPVAAPRPRRSAWLGLAITLAVIGATGGLVWAVGGGWASPHRSEGDDASESHDVTVAGAPAEPAEAPPPAGSDVGAARAERAAAPEVEAESATTTPARARSVRESPRRSSRSGSSGSSRRSSKRWDWE